jgi:peptidyl-prolyl cis-trans isomerase A (cyclophilin A)
VQPAVHYDARMSPLLAVLAAVAAFAAASPAAVPGAPPAPVRAPAISLPGDTATPSAGPPVAATASPAAAPLPRVRLRTALGDVVVEVDVVRAPVTGANFLRYVEAGRYDGARFHRTVTSRPDNQPTNVVKIEVVQAGPPPARLPDGGVDEDRNEGDRAPIPLERTRDTGLAHVDGALSMARGAPDTATSDFFLCVGPQPELDFGGRRNPDGQGFAAFGRVVSGMEVVRRIHRSHASGQTLDPPIAILEAIRIDP